MSEILVIKDEIVPESIEDAYPLGSDFDTLLPMLGNGYYPPGQPGIGFTAMQSLPLTPYAEYSTMTPVHPLEYTSTHESVEYPSITTRELGVSALLLELLCATLCVESDD